MSVLIAERVQQALVQLHLRSTAERLDGLLSEAARKELSFLDFLDHLTRYELESKQRKRTLMGIQIAHFPGSKSLADFDYAFQPSVDKKLMTELATGRFIANGENVVLFGPPGVGKTHLAIGLGRAVIEAGYSALFISTAALIGALSKAESEGKLDEKLGFFAKPKLLIIDELGYLPFERRSAHLLFQLVSRRYEKGSLLITTNQSVGQWGQVFGDEVVAAAILDRLLHHSHVMVMQGQSYRLRQKKKAGVMVAEPEKVEGKTSRKLEKFHPQRRDPQPTSKSEEEGGQIECRQGVNFQCRLTRGLLVAGPGGLGVSRLRGFASRRADVDSPWQEPRGSRAAGVGLGAVLCTSRFV